MYNNNVPLSGQTLGETQSPIRTNFSLIQQLITQDHYDFNTGNQGKHKFVHLPVTTIPASNAGESTFYSKAVSGVSELFFTPDASGDEYQLTSTNTAEFAEFGANPGWTFLPGGLLLQYGTYTPGGDIGDVAVTITFPVTFTTAYNITINIVRNNPSTNQGEVIRTLSNGSFVFKLASGSSSATSLYWQAIGKA